MQESTKRTIVIIWYKLVFDKTSIRWTPNSYIYLCHFGSLLMFIQKKGIVILMWEDHIETTLTCSENVLKLVKCSCLKSLCRLDSFKLTKIHKTYELLPLFQGSGHFFNISVKCDHEYQSVVTTKVSINFDHQTAFE